MKTRARAARWKEEVLLVVEEMRRVLWFLNWRATEWKSQGRQRQVMDSNLQDGLTAYANKQSRIFKAMAHRFGKLWYPELAGHNIEMQWPPEFLCT